MVQNPELSTKVSSQTTSPLLVRLSRGGPNSAYLFLILVELFAISLRANVTIKGLPVKEICEFLNQFADDTDMLLEGTADCINEVFSEVRHFEHISGMKINYDKTTLFRVGSLANSSRNLC